MNSLNAFIWDQHLRAFESVESLYKSTSRWNLCEKLDFISCNDTAMDFWEQIYLERVNYIRENVSLLIQDKTNPPEKIDFHSQFGWVLECSGIKAYLGKCSLSRSIKIEIGNRSYFSGHSNLRGSGTMRIGNYCSIAEGLYVNVEPDFHPITFPATYNFRDNVRLRAEDLSLPMQYEDSFENAPRGITIGNDVWIARNVRIFHGVKISDGCVIGENAMVRTDCEPYGVYCGIPARLVRYRFPHDIISQLQNIRWWDWPFEKIKKNKAFFDTNLLHFKGNIESLIR